MAGWWLDEVKCIFNYHSAELAAPTDYFLPLSKNRNYLFIYIHLRFSPFCFKEEAARVSGLGAVGGGGARSHPSEWARVHARRNRLSHCRQMWGRGGDGSCESLRRRVTTLERRHKRWPAAACTSRARPHTALKLSTCATCIKLRHAGGEMLILRWMIRRKSQFLCCRYTTYWNEHLASFGSF